ncbi:uncharacterized protein LOC127853338 [Dreissena polymorpha]|uniref:uncharacterized protein LOC127853338 n=1 Tax=Dreissena polymorpha TaxID=45954 RepID=UPI002263EECB|nr:uncharacterized protein LOC127853338 [Dreissena polymorpha]
MWPPTADLTLLLSFLFFNLLHSSSPNRNTDDRWEHILIRYGFWYKLPSYQSMAFKDGYKRINDVCKTEQYHGFLFRRGDNMKAMPIYDLNGNLAGVQAAIPGNMVGFNSMNVSIELPQVEIQPPLLKDLRQYNGVIYYFVTAYFKHPQLICSPMTSKGAGPEKGLYIQLGYNPENDFLHIPQDSSQLSPLWRKGNCRPQMGTLYFMNMSRSLPCEKIYPLFLLYDMEGKLGAFGWIFQGRPNNFFSEDGMGWFHLTPVTYPFLYDPSMLPSCMFYEAFQVFGIHIYLQEPNRLLCKPIANVRESSTVSQTKLTTVAADIPTDMNFKPHERFKPNERLKPSADLEDFAIEAVDRPTSLAPYMHTAQCYVVLSVILVNVIKQTFA